MTAFPPPAAPLDRWHAAVRSRPAPRAALASAATAVWFALLVLLNGHHLGADAALHWDATAALSTSDPMPTAAQLAAARGHVFDLAREAGSDDPAVVTAYFLSPAAAGRHGPLETVRRYYSQLSYSVTRRAFALGAAATGSPTGGVVAFQLTAAALIAVGLGLLTALAVATAPPGPRLPLRLGMAALAFAAVAAEPVFLSIARQVLTETVGFALLVPTLLLAAAAVRRPWVAVPAAACLFLTVRSRYNLALSAVGLLPLVLLLTGTHRGDTRRLCRALLLGCATFALCVAVDAVAYGPMFMPWVYDEALVRSTRLYFHNRPPYDQFWVALYVNGPLLVLPMAGVACWWLGRPRDRLAAAYAAAVLVLATAPIVAMARQQVSYQPRHLFAFSGGFACVLMLTVARVRWRPWTAVPFAAACLLTLGANVYSAVGPQRTTMRDPWPWTIAQTLRHRWTTLGPHPPWPRVLLDGYFDWSDNRRLHDPLVALRRARHEPGRPLLVVGGGVDGSGYYLRWATRFGPPAVWWPATGTWPASAAAVDAALAAGRPVFAVLPAGATLAGFRLAPTGVPLDEAVIYRVTARP